MRDNLFGVSVPDAVVARLEQAEDPAAEGRRICIEMIQGLRTISGVAGVHLMAPLQKIETLAAIVDESGLQRPAA
jgi:methylenetetrahydrofolate reductase (NADPH)